MQEACAGLQLDLRGQMGLCLGLLHVELGDGFLASVRLILLLVYIRKQFQEFHIGQSI